MNDDAALRVHDLVLLRPSDITAARLAGPSWVKAMLEETPWAVVRREAASAREVAVGVRGHDRQQRWGGFVTLSSIAEVVRADQLRSSQRQPNRRSLPALRALECLEGHLEGHLEGLNLLWGPIGSVGFELATGRHTTRPASDLDLVIYAHQRIEKAEARKIWAITKTLPGRVDIKVETPFCGFSLEDYVNDRSPLVLLRMASGFRLGLDPWALLTEEGY